MAAKPLFPLTVATSKGPVTFRQVGPPIVAVDAPKTPRAGTRRSEGA